MSLSVDVHGFYADTVSFAEKLAPLVCRGGLADADNCSWYHGSWPLLRRLGLVSNPFWHEQFYRDAAKFVGCASDMTSIIAGTADFSMPALWQSASDTNIICSDICPTPLIISREYAASHGHRWGYVISDIAKLPQTVCGKADIIVNDAFLTRFCGDEKSSILNAISLALRTGGYYITTVRIKETCGDKYIPNQENMDAFVKRAIDRSKIYGLDEYIVGNMAREYINRMVSNPFPSADALVHLLESQRFYVEILYEDEVEGEAERSQYARVVARKR